MPRSFDGLLVLEDGHAFVGTLFGAPPGQAEASAALDTPGGGEVVFNTSSTGYQEILTDPSYAGQIVTLTTPHIGNYGTNTDDVESSRIRAAGLIVRDHHPLPSNWRSNRALDDYLVDAGVPGLADVDTRGLVLHTRDFGAKRGVVAALPAIADADGLIDGRPLPLRFVLTDDAPDAAGLRTLRHPSLDALLARARAVPSMAGLDLATVVTRGEREVLEPAPGSEPPDGTLTVALLDFGAKHNIARQLCALGCRVHVLPAQTDAQTILALDPDGVMLSNGPGDPEPVTYAVQTIRALLGERPIFGICLGHQLLGLACGARTFKLPFGHRGGNHPVRELDTGKVEITAQNHGFALDPSSLNGKTTQITHINLNDETVAGIRHKLHPAFSVQFHPEASPGPHDSHHLFQRFAAIMRRERKRR